MLLEESKFPIDARGVISYTARVNAVMAPHLTAQNSKYKSEHFYLTRRYSATPTTSTKNRKGARLARPIW